MKTHDLNSWSDFPTAIADIRHEFGSRKMVFEDRELTISNDILFRGNADSEWRLETTLERTVAERYSVSHYLERATAVINEIESLTKRDWQVPSWPTIREEIRATQDSIRAYLPCYKYLAYLRHHGFPSPLMDWTTSPYIAAYFAFEPRITAERCAIFAFIERPQGGKSRSSQEAGIYSLGPYVTTHNRHFAQKSRYTYATEWDHQKREHIFCSHDSVSPPAGSEQDILFKITIPRRDRTQALHQLEDFNINHHSLFQSEDSLVRMLGMRAFELSD